MKQTPVAKSFSHRVPWIAPLTICAVGFVLYSFTFSASFLFDDFAGIVENPVVRAGDPLGLLRHWPPRALTFLTFAVNYALHGRQVIGYRVVNLAIHLGNGVLVFWLVLLLCRAPALRDRGEAENAVVLAWLAGLIFAAHPLQIEAVTYIVQRLESLAALFYLLAVCFYLEARLRRRQRRSWGGWYAASLASAVAGAFAKETIVTLPGALALIEVCLFAPHHGKFRAFVRDRAPLIAPYLLVTLLVPVMLYIFTPSSGSLASNLHRLSGGVQRRSRWEYFITQFRVIIAYLRLTLLPTWQSIDPQVRTSKTLWEGMTLTSLAVLALIVWGALRGLRRWPLQALGILWVFVTLSVTSSLLPIYDAMAEHRMYLPLAGAALALAAALLGAWRSAARRGWPRATSMVCVVAVVVCLAVLTVSRNWTWIDETRLWADTARKSPRNPRPYVNLGLSYQHHGAHDRALHLFQRALRADASHLQVWSEVGILNYMGHSFVQRGWNDRAAMVLLQTLRLEPAHAQARNNFAVAAIARGRHHRALREARLAAKHRPNLSEAYINQGAVYFQTSRLTKALAAYRRAQYLQPDHTGAAESVAGILYSLGLFKRALAASRYSLRLQPDNAVIRQNVQILERKLRRRR